MKRQVSLSLRLTLWFSATFVLGFVVFGIAMYLQLSYSLAAGRDKTLMHRSDRAIALLTHCHGLDAACEQKFNDFFAATPEGNLIRVLDAQGQVLLPRMPPPPPAAFPWPGQHALNERSYAKVWHQGAAFRTLLRPATIGATQYVVAIGGQLADNRALVAQFRNGLLWAVPLFLVLSAWFGYFFSTRVLRPVSRLITSFRSISISNLSRRLPALYSGDELEALTVTCNDMLDRLEAAVERVTRFTADASHELRSPLSCIYTQSEFALGNLSLDEEAAECFTDILHECEEATALLNDMLTLARCDSGNAGMTFARVDLRGLLEEVYCKALPLAQRERHQLTLEAARSDVWVMGDASGLRRLFWSLLENAIKYTPAGGVIALRMAIVGDEVHVEVQDNGLGIPDSALPFIFDRFYRADRSRTHTEGTGLGLSIAKWISDLHRGGLAVQSREHVGSTFHLSFSLLGATA